MHAEHACWQVPDLYAKDTWGSASIFTYQSLLGGLTFVADAPASVNGSFEGPAQPPEEGKIQDMGDRY